MKKLRTFHIGENVLIKKANKIFVLQFLIALFLINLFLCSIDEKYCILNNINNIFK